MYRQFVHPAFDHPISATERTELLYCPTCGVQNVCFYFVFKFLNLYFSLPARDQALCIGPYKNEPCAQLSLLGHVSGSGGVAYAFLFCLVKYACHQGMAYPLVYDGCAGQQAQE